MPVGLECRPALRTYLAKTFGYRRLYVDAIVERAPARAALAVWSEVARLAFVAFGCALVALVCWPLAVAAYGRDGFIAGWTVSALGCALVASAGGIGALSGVVQALRDRGRVRAAVEARADR